MESFLPLIEENIRQSIPSFGPQTGLRDAVEYALTNGGHRYRPCLVHHIAAQLGLGFDVSDAALAVEFFHTASLIADDLPCMDNDDARRGKPALHKAFDECTALLATYALIAEGYERIRLASKLHGPSVGFTALGYATKNTGIHGATGGQYLDLYKPEDLKKVIEKKTGTLFEISFIFGWLFGGGDMEQLSVVEKLSQDFGMAFQIRDDFDDTDQDTPEKNYVLAQGASAAKQTLLQVEQQLEEGLKELNITL